ncbi:MAG: NUDIX domain-containing protein, partial [Myxococcales bacterium]|nr:NUDIX domain-containing protein [Myxococcales bacterium]
MPIVSAGLLLTRRVGPLPELLLVHPGGPFYTRRDDGWWSIPKGQVEPGESLLEAAVREVREETGWEVAGPFVPLGFVDQSKKRVHAWAVVHDVDPATLVSNTVDLEWPPRSGVRLPFPEIDRAAWLDPIAATQKILPAQAPFLLRCVGLWA